MVDVTTGYLLCTGSRKCPDWLKGIVHTKLHGIVRTAGEISGGHLKRFEVIVGDAPGVDAEVRAWVRAQQTPNITLHEGAPFVATWDADCDERCAPDHRKERLDGTTFCPAQGPYRNTRMVALARQYHDAGAWVRGAAFYADPKSTGTGDCVRQAKAARLIVAEFGNAPERNPQQEVLGMRTSGAYELRQNGS